LTAGSNPSKPEATQLTTADLRERRRQQTHRSDILFTFAVLIGIYVAYRVMDVLLLVYVSALFAVVLAPAIGFVRRLQIGKWRPGRGAAVLIIIVTMLAVIVFTLLFALPPIFSDAQEMAQNWPVRLAALTERIRSVPFFDNFNPNQLKDYASSVLGGAFGFFRNIAGGVFGFFSWFILTAYFILDGERAFRWGVSLFPKHQQPRLEKTLIRAENRMRHWLVGQAALMMILGTSCALVFGLLHLKYFYALAVFAGLANIIPIVGPIAAVTLAGVVALFDSPAKFVGVLAFFAVYQQIETAFLTPRIMRSTVDLPALSVIIALLLGGALAGVLGALVAVPTAALCAVLIDEYLVNKTA
jgi:predicted PurR-regulated permease PerM